MKRPLVIDLFCGSFGWSEAFVANGWRSVGFDISHEPYHGAVPEHCHLVLQDVLTIHGSQFRTADCIVASPPCQTYSWLAMPWSRSAAPNCKRARELRQKWETEGPDNRLFDACFRIQREAIEAAGHFIPLIVENVRGAQEWVGRSAFNYSAFHMWGDLPALMPRPTGESGTKIGGDWFSDPNSTCRKHGSRSQARKAASAQIAKIPFPLAEHIAITYKPRAVR